MKRILLLGKGKAVFDDIFKYMIDDFEIQTTSIRSADIKSHLKYFRPELVVVCLQKEMIEEVVVLNEFKKYFEKKAVPVILIGSNEECLDFQQKTYSLGKLALLKPISARNIKSRLTEFMEIWDKEHEIAEEPVEEQTAVPKQAAEPKPAVSVAPAQDTNTAANVTPEKTAGEEEKKHILVVDDDPMMLKLIKEHLKHKYAVGTAVSGKIALKFLETKKTDLVLLDYEMPVENGAQVMEQIRNNKATAKLPIVFLTGMADKEKIKKVISLKPQGYMLKPVDKDILLQTIEQIIG